MSNSETNLDEIKANNNEEEIVDNQIDSKYDENYNENNNIIYEKTEINDIQNKI